MYYIILRDKKNENMSNSKQNIIFINSKTNGDIVENGYIPQHKNKDISPLNTSKVMVRNYPFTQLDEMKTNLKLKIL